MAEFKITSNFKPMGDQPAAIDKLVDGLNKGYPFQTLLGVTGSGKTYTISNVIKRYKKPTLILAHNKTLAGQLYQEFKEFFKENHVEYFISYYDFYQPEAYIAHTDTYIEKDSKINDEIDEMRHSATARIIDCDDVIVIASVSCIYGIGDPETYKDNMITVRSGETLDRDELIDKLIKNQYARAKFDFERGTFRVLGETIEILPTYNKSKAYRIEFDFDEVTRIREFDTMSGEIYRDLKVINFFPATQFMSDDKKFQEALRRIREELETRVKYFHDKNLLVEEYRIKQRTLYDLEMLEEMHTCSGVENYSRHLALRDEGEAPATLIDFFDDFLMVIDESHVTLPQVKGMYNGDRARKLSLVENGFRLPSALDNRPLKFDEFIAKLKHCIFVSATPGEFELEKSSQVVEQIIRPTGLLDPLIEVHDSTYQIDDAIKEVKKTIAKKERVLITTLTIKMSEDLTNYLKQAGIKVAYLHSKIKSLDRLDIITDLRKGVYDCIVGVNLLREGLDMPEVSKILILDADSEGFLRSEKSLIQTIGRAARNSDGKVVLYAKKITNSMEKAISETKRRREIQAKYNLEHHITPKTIHKEIRDSVRIAKVFKDGEELIRKKKYDAVDLSRIIMTLDKEMKKAAKELDFEKAAELRDAMMELKVELDNASRN